MAGMAEMVNIDVLIWAAALLSVERICYVWIYRDPGAFRELSARAPILPSEPTDALRALFIGFKVLQVGVFAWWCLVHSGGTLWPISAPAWAVGVGLALIAAGQALNIGVFRRLGHTGVFYGNRFGYEVPWYTGFPFTVTPHPQYVGSLLTIWGAFLILRFPHADWLVLPMLESAYYALIARLERPPAEELQPLTRTGSSHGTFT
jgi:protein-S-isoprenylcysteine O-methyltransferase Ste14